MSGGRSRTSEPSSTNFYWVYKKGKRYANVLREDDIRNNIILSIFQTQYLEMYSTTYLAFYLTTFRHLCLVFIIEISRMLSAKFVTGSSDFLNVWRTDIS